MKYSTEEEMIDRNLKLVEIEVENSTHKINELYEKIVNSDFAEKVIEYFELSKRQDRVLQKIKDRKNKG